MTRWTRLLVWLVALGFALPAVAKKAPPPEKWIFTWACAPQLCEVKNLPPSPGFDDCTLRQFVRVSIGGKTLRLRLTNEFGDAPLTILGVRVALGAEGSAIDSATDQALKFGGQATVVIPAGSQMLSDPLDFPLAPLARVALTLQLKGAPRNVTAHPGSRTTSYFIQDGDSGKADFSHATTVDHWYFISGVEVKAPSSCNALAVLGDSITDGRGTTTNQDNRWPDDLSRRLQAETPKHGVAVLNMGIGGNRVLQDGLGPSALSRLDRDVLAQPGVKWLIVFEAINDLGTAVDDRKNGRPAATAQDLILAYQQIIQRAHDHDIRVYGATITPYGGCFYYSEEGEADRQALNQWIRTSRAFDAVIDFDQALRDPDDPLHLAASFDSGDHLHLNPAGYQVMAQTVDLKLFK